MEALIGGWGGRWWRFEVSSRTTLLPQCLVLLAAVVCRSGSIRLDQEGPLTAQGGFRLRMQQQTAGRGVQRQRPQRVADEALDTFPWDVPYREEEANPPAGSASAASGKPSVTHFIPPALVWWAAVWGGSAVDKLRLLSTRGVFFWGGGT